MSIVDYPPYNVQMPPTVGAVGQVLALSAVGTPSQFEWADLAGADAIVKNPATSESNVVNLSEGAPVGLVIRSEGLWPGGEGEPTPRCLILERYDSSNHGNHLEMRTARGTFASPEPSASGDFIGGVVGYGYNGTSFQDATSFSGWITSVSGGTIVGMVGGWTRGPSDAKNRFSCNHNGFGINLPWPHDPAFRLHVEGDSSVVGNRNFSNDTASAAYVGCKARGTQASPSGVQANDGLVALCGRGYHSGGAWGTGNVGLFAILAAENFTSTAQGTYAVIGTTPIGSTTRAERVRVTDTGCVGIGVTAPTAWLHLQAGTTTMAPIKLVAGPLKTTPTDGDLEYGTDGHLYFTIGTTRTQII